MDKSEPVAAATHALYARLTAAGFDVLVDDRAQRPGFKFADADLIGIPHRLVLSEKTLGQQMAEYKQRRSQDSELVPIDGLETWLADQ